MRRIYMVGNTHFDPVWLWKWDEGMASVRATFRSALDRMREDPDFIYSFASPPVFEWIRRTDPEMFAEIKGRVAEGRWELAEGWWVQPDCYAAGGESYVRQGLYGQKYLRENFGRTATGVFNIDSFGHSPQLPQILRKSGIDHNCFCRPEAHHLPLPAPLFRWRGLDGSVLPMFRAEAAFSQDLAAALAAQPEGGDDLLMVYGVTDHGGAPTKRMLAAIHAHPGCEFSTVERFFREHAAGAPEYAGELLTRDFGTYANLPEIKRLNRLAETAVRNAEVATLLAGVDARAELEGCWHDVLFNQFHDIIGGAAIRQAYDDARAGLGRACATANELTHFALQRRTRDIATLGVNPYDCWNLVLWNLNGTPYRGYVEAEVQCAYEFDWYDGGVELEDESGRRYPCQVIREWSAIKRFRSRFVFHAAVPAAGHLLLRHLRTGAAVTPPAGDPFHVVTRRLEVAFDRTTGTVAEIRRRDGKRLCGALLVPVCRYDDGDTWCFNVKEYGAEAKPCVLRESRVTETGALRATVKFTYVFQDSRIEMYYTFYEDELWFDVAWRVNWNEKHHVLKLETPAAGRHRVAVPYGSVERDESVPDVPLGDWLRIGGMTLLCDGIFAYNLHGGTLGLTVLRSPIYGDLRNAEIDYGEDYSHLSQGLNEGRARVFFGEAGAAEAQAFRNPPLVVCEANHGGTLPRSQGALALTAPTAVVTALKRAEDGDGVVVRMVEPEGRAQAARLEYGGRGYPLSFAPFEIKTLRIAPSGAAAEAALTEEPLPAPVPAPPKR